MATKQETVSTHFGIGSKIPFIDVPTKTDIALYLDPLRIGLSKSKMGAECSEKIRCFFQLVVERIRKTGNAFVLLEHLKEPNEIHFGLSSNSPDGTGVSGQLAHRLDDALMKSAAVRKGLIQAIEETELMIEGISFDKISDVCANIIRPILSVYTSTIAKKYGLPTAPFPFLVFDFGKGAWLQQDLVAVELYGTPLLLVPNDFASHHPAFSRGEYYSRIMMPAMKEEWIGAGHRLTRLLKSGRRVIRSKDFRANHPPTKPNINMFAAKHPKSLLAYRDFVETKLKMFNP